MARPRQVTDDQIDAAARATFVEFGPTAAVWLIAEKLGVSHAALLQRAGSKEKLLLRALRPGVPQLMAHLELPPPEHGKAARLEALLRELLAFHEQMLPGLMVLRAGGVPIEVPRGEGPPTRVLRGLLKRWLMRATTLSRRRAAALAEGLLGAIEARCFNAWAGGPRFVEGPGGAFIHLLVSGLIPELSAPSRKGAAPVDGALARKTSLVSA